MPYLEQRAKEMIDAGMTPETSGELNYAITRLIIRYLSVQPKINYEALNSVDGALDLCKSEFQRRIVFPYEDGKIEANGDVYDELIEAMNRGGS
jgi:hypothetical protein